MEVDLPVLNVKRQLFPEPDNEPKKMMESPGGETWLQKHKEMADQDEKVCEPAEPGQAGPSLPDGHLSQGLDAELKQSGNSGEKGGTEGRQDATGEPEIDEPAAATSSGGPTLNEDDERAQHKAQLHADVPCENGQESNRAMNQGEQPPPTQNGRASNHAMNQGEQPPPTQNGQESNHAMNQGEQASRTQNGAERHHAMNQGEQPPPTQNGPESNNAMNQGEQPPPAQPVPKQAAERKEVDGKGGEPQDIFDVPEEVSGST